MNTKRPSFKDMSDRITVDSRIMASCQIAMMGVLTDVGLREDKSWGDDEEALLGKLMEAANTLSGYIIEDVKETRAKDGELIQRLVDQVEACRVELCSAIPHLPRIGVKLATAREAECRSMLDDAAAQGFKPSEQ